MGFFTFSQNNSGGVDIGPRYIIIQARNADWANDLALDHGIYFDGVRRGYDCDCCGDRWSRADEGDATDVPEIWGDPAADWDGDASQIKIVKSQS
jgi:hypothetical protein